MMKILRTPDSYFEGLEDYGFAPHYTTIQADDGTPIRIHHIDEGPCEAQPILLMHGNPSWSYLHRKMVRMLLKTGRRVIAVDLVGLGRSDKPASKEDYTLARHYDWMSQWLIAMKLKNITLYCQDWGGTIGLYLVSMHPQQFDRVVISNSGMPLGEGGTPFFEMWLDMMEKATVFPWEIFWRGFHKPISEAVRKGYMAPFPGPEYQAGITSFPGLIAVRPDNPGAPINRAAWERLKRFDKPFLTVFGALDPASRGLDQRLQKAIPGAAGRQHLLVDDASHFIQEDAPEVLVEQICNFLNVSA